MEIHIIEENDIVKKYIHHIRNTRYLNLDMIQNISNMSKQNILEIISTFNDVINNLKIIISELMDN